MTLSFKHGDQVKPLHLSFLACLAVLSSEIHANAGLFDAPRWRTATVFRPVTGVETIFRAQSDEVPLPRGAGSAPIGSPNMSTQPAPSGGIVQPGGLMIPSDGSPGQQYYGSPIAPAGGFMVPSGGESFFQSPAQTVDGTVGGQAYPSTSDPSTWNAFSPPIGPDPFAGGGVQQPYAPFSPYGGGVAPGAAGAFSTYGANGPAPFRLGWHTDFTSEWIPEAAVSGNAGGNFEQYGFDYDLGYTGSLIPGWMFTFTNQVRMRNWDGPVGGPGLPGEAYRLGWDLELVNPNPGPVSMKLGITPSINTDFNGSLGSGAYQLDGRGMFIFQLDQYWSMVLGASYWDRVEDRVIPYGGLVYRDDYWDVRLMYPETTISVFVGNEALGAKWMYVRAEYHVEAYEVRTAGDGRDQVEFEDYRLMLGFRMDSGMHEWFTEGGWIFDRTVDYSAPANGSFVPEASFLLRTGFKF